jgi:hypothetical protein
MRKRRKVSDTVSITSDGEVIVDVQKLFAKEHMRDTIRQIREKTRFVTRPTPLKFSIDR